MVDFSSRASWDITYLFADVILDYYKKEFCFLIYICISLIYFSYPPNTKFSPHHINVITDGFFFFLEKLSIYPVTVFFKVFAVQPVLFLFSILVTQNLVYISLHQIISILFIGRTIGLGINPAYEDKLDLYFTSSSPGIGFSFFLLCFYEL
jgi:hypothetical protein